MSIEKKNNSNESEVTHNQARQHIEAVRGEIASMGANDSEFESLNTIIEELNNRIISPQEAVNRANGVRDSKQSYH
jgi:hypothetical protein